MEQTRLGSLIEAVFNTAIGYVVNIGAQQIIFPLCGIHVSFATSNLVALLFTLVRIVRSYVVRRWFNAMLRRAAQRLAERSSS